MSTYKVAVVGATGAVGSEMVKVLAQRSFPVSNLRLFATSKSAGRVVSFRGSNILVEDIEKADSGGIEIAFFAGGEVPSARFVPEFVKKGALAVDNSSTFRMDKDVPLIVPEVNPEDLKSHKGIIANPNCSTIQMVIVLKPIMDRAGIERIIVSTYQSVSGTGRDAVEELKEQTGAVINGGSVIRKIYPHQIAFNIFPHIGDFGADGYCQEERKMIDETRKILGEPGLKITATACRVPVMTGHCEAVNIKTKKKLGVEETKKILAEFPGVLVLDNPEEALYPTPLQAEGGDLVLAGRIREDLSQENGLDLWIAADNLRKGAALNAVQIAEKMIEMELLK